jgi:L-threonylcarbamoyladenylate synthase
MTKLEKAVQILKSGGVVVYPTDTVYGLAVDAANAKAVKKLYALKGREFNKPVHVIPPTKSWIEKIVKLNPAAKRIIEALMPGPLTLVLPLKISGPSWRLLAAGTKTLGIRRPKNKLALDLAAGLGRPITTTSANLSGRPSCYSAAAVKRQFQQTGLRPDYYLDAGRLPKRAPSTVAAFLPSPPAPLPRMGEGGSRRSNLFNVKIIRPGPVTERQLQRAAG